MSENRSGRFRKKKVCFSMVSNTLIRDESISLKAKGLYTLIQSYVTLEDFTVYKSFLQSKCCEGKKAFDAAWKELKEKGYLKQYRLQDSETKQFVWEYELLDSPELDNDGESVEPEAPKAKAEPKAPEKKKAKSKKADSDADLENKKPHTQKGDMGNTTEPYTPLVSHGSGMSWEKGVYNNTIHNNTIYNNNLSYLSDVMGQIEAEYFPVEAKDQVMQIAMLIQEVYALDDTAKVKVAQTEMYALYVKERFKQLNKNHIEYVLKALKGNSSNIKNIKAYLLASLFNAPVTIASYYQNKVNQMLSAL